MSVSTRSDAHELEPSTIAAAVRACAARLAAVSETPRLDAEVLLAHAIVRARSSLHAHPERRLAPPESRAFAALVARRAAGEPVAYLTGEREFFSLPLRITPAVLIPRPETELLVEAALARSAPQMEPRILDVGTGSGALALAIKRALPSAAVTGSDVSQAALEVARANAERLALDVRLVASRWLDAFAGERFDCIVSNPPYLLSAEIRGSLEREPRLALDGGVDGLDAYRALLAAAPARLAPGGALLVEHGHEQRTALTALAEASGWRVAALHDDLAGLPRVLELQRSGAR
jgi:release factor glutamine methyltransferase